MDQDESADMIAAFADQVRDSPRDHVLTRVGLQMICPKIYLRGYSLLRRITPINDRTYLHRLSVEGCNVCHHGLTHTVIRLSDFRQLSW